MPFREEELWNGYPEETNAPYGIAKKTLLVGAQAYREQYGLNSIFLLPTNLYGPRDKFHPTNAHVIPDLIRKMLESPDEVVLWGDGSPTREFLYVEDCVEGLVLAADRYDGPDPVNLGAGKEISIRELAELVAEVTGFEGRIEWDTSKPNGQPRRSIDATARASSSASRHARRSAKGSSAPSPGTARRHRPLPLRSDQRSSSRCSSSARRCARIEFWSERLEMTVA